MSYEIVYNSDSHFLGIKIQGKYAFAEGKELIVEVAKAIKKNDCFLLLVDVRDIESGFSIFELFETPRILHNVMSAADIPVHQIKRAVLTKKGMLTSVFDSKFMEDVNTNSGLKMKLFHDMDEAQKWLLK